MAKPYYHRHDAWKKANPLREGSPCPRCRQPMSKRQALDVGHVIDATAGGAYGNLRWEHRHCNRSAGGKIGNKSAQKRNKSVPAREVHSEDW